jgi:hypothetical protein
LPDTHPLRRFYDRSNAFVPADNFGEDSIIRSLYEWPAFAPFIQEVLEEPSFYRYADPLADVVINLAEEGNGFPWHFDTNNYTVTLAIQNAELGGEFEFSPNLRTPTDENYDGVSALMGLPLALKEQEVIVQKEINNKNPLTFLSNNGRIFKQHGHPSGYSVKPQGFGKGKIR